MKTQLITIIFTIIALFNQVCDAQNVTVGGSDIKVSNGASVYIPGDIAFIADIEVENDGIIAVGGNWNNNATSDLDFKSGSGTVVFNGTSGQTIGGNSRTFFGNLTIEQFVDLENETHVSGILQLNNAKLALNKYNLFIGTNGLISGAGQHAYLVAQLEGLLVREVGDEEVIFPVGTSSSYLPATLLNTGTADNFGINVFADILDLGTSGVTIPEIDHCVLNTWNIMEQYSGGSNLTINLQWNAENERVLFDRTKSGIGYFHDGAWTGQAAGHAAGNNPYSLTRAGLTTVGTFAVGDEDSPMAIPIVYDEHNILLYEGWSGISSYLVPVNPGLENIMAPVVNDLIILQNFDGYFWPVQGLNTLGNWNSHAGYQIKMETTQQLILSGTIQNDLTISLNTGWNYLPVPVACDVAVDDLFLSLSEDLVIVKEIAGWGIYWPAMNINTIGQLLPGKAYFVKMNSAGNVDFPACENLPGLRNLEGLDKTLSGLVYNITPTPSTHTIAILPEALKGIEQGILIGAYDQAGNCYGAAVYNSETISLTVFGNDPTTVEKDGFFEGEMIFFKNLRGLANLEGLNPTFDPQLSSADGLFTENGLSSITGFDSSIGVGFHDFGGLVNIFPNPSDGVVNITGLKAGAKISVSDTKGQIVLSTAAPTDEIFRIDLSYCTAGVYFVKFEQNGEIIFRKLVLR